MNTFETVLTHIAKNKIVERIVKTHFSKKVNSSLQDDMAQEVYLQLCDNRYKDKVIDAFERNKVEALIYTYLKNSLIQKKNPFYKNLLSYNKRRLDGQIGIN